MNMDRLLPVLVGLGAMKNIAAPIIYMLKP